MMRVVMRERQWMKIEKMGIDEEGIPEVWQQGVYDEGGKAEAGDYKDDRVDCEEPDT